MSQEIKLKARIQNKYETLEKWNEISREENFIPLKGEVCYGIKDDILYQKIGDGSTNFVDLPWLTNQADYNENDENSPTYIKNRLAYESYEAVPEDEQDMGTTIFEASPSYPTEDILKEFLDFPEEQIGIIKENYFTFQKESDSPYVVDNLHVFSGEMSISSELESLMTDENNKFIISLGTQENYETKFNLDYKLKPMNPIYGDSDPEFKYYNCIGNPAWASLMFYWYVSSDYEYPFDLSNEEELQLDYGFLTIGPFTEDGETTMMILGVLDSNKYLAYKTLDSSDPDSEPEELFSFSWTMNHIEHLYTKTIDKKFLIDTQADQRVIDSSKGNYIKNRFGEMAVIHYNPMANDYPLEHFECDITLGGTAGGFSLVSQASSTTSIPESFFASTRECTVIINGETHSHCPIYTMGSALNSDRGTSSSSYVLGNPTLMGEFFELLLTDAEKQEFYAGKTISKIDENNLPFYFPLSAEDSTPINAGTLVSFQGYGKGSKINIKIYPEDIILYTNPIPNNLLPDQYIVGQYDDDHNSVLLNGAYEASGSNSLAANYGTKATGAYSTALGDNTEATGIGSLSSGKNTYTQGSHSLITGDSNNAYGNNSLTLGTQNFGYGDNSLTLGAKVENRVDNSIVAGEAVEHIISDGTFSFPEVSRYRIKYTSNSFSPNSYKRFWIYDKVRFQGTSSNIGISSVELLPEENSCIIDLVNSVPNDASLSSPTFIRDCKIAGSYTGDYGMVIGKGAQAEGAGIAMGEGVTAHGNQAVIGTYNTPLDDGMFIVGNGDMYNSSNAFVVNEDGTVLANDYQIFATDEDGNLTSKSIQGDMEQSDPTQIDYIKNRTHYREWTKFDNYIHFSDSSDKDKVIDSSGNYPFVKVNEKFDLKTDGNYQVKVEAFNAVTNERVQLNDQDYHILDLFITNGSEYFEVDGFDDIIVLAHNEWGGMVINGINHLEDAISSGNPNLITRENNSYFFSTSAFYDFNKSLKFKLTLTGPGFEHEDWVYTKIPNEYLPIGEEIYKPITIEKKTELVYPFRARVEENSTSPTNDKCNVIPECMGGYYVVSSFGASGGSNENGSYTIENFKVKNHNFPSCDFTFLPSYTVNSDNTITYIDYQLPNLGDIIAFDIKDDNLDNNKKSSYVNYRIVKKSTEVTGIDERTEYFPKQPGYNKCDFRVFATMTTDDQSLVENFQLFDMMFADVDEEMIRATEKTITGNNCGQLGTDERVYGTYINFDAECVDCKASSCIGIIKGTINFYEDRMIIDSELTSIPALVKNDTPPESPSDSYIHKYTTMLTQNKFSSKKINFLEDIKYLLFFKNSAVKIFDIEIIWR